MSEKPVLNLPDVGVVDDLGALYGGLREAGAAAVVDAEPIGDCEFRLVIGYQALREAAADPGRLSSEAEGVTIPTLRMPTAIPVEIDPPNHRKYRRLLVPELRPDRVGGWLDGIRREADWVLDQFTEAGEGDLTAVARHVPPATIARVLGVPDDGPIMVDLTTRVSQTAVTGDTAGQAAALADLVAYLDRVVADAEGSGRDDLLAVVANAEVDGEPIGRERAVAIMVTLIMAGQDTTINGIANTLARLGAMPEVKRALAADPALIPAAVEESLRIESPVQAMGRTAVADTELDGCPVHAGERIGLLWGAANHDPAEFERPGEFRLDRENSSAHVAFGSGVHRCVGEHLARAEMIIVTERVLARIPDYELAEPAEHWASNPMNRGVRRLPVRFTPGPRVL